MITPYKNRTIDFNEPVMVYRNLTNKCYSIQQDGLVKGHTPEITLMDCEFVVRKYGQKKVRETKQKNVHAFIKGYITQEKLPTGYRLTYNPYTDDGFKVKGSEGILEKCTRATFTSDGVFIQY